MMRSCIFLSLVVVFLAALSPGQVSFGQASPEEESSFEMEKAYNASWALIIGINYEDPNRDEADRIALPQLENAEKDARSVAHVLKTYYGYEEDKVVLLLNEAATSSAILKTLGEFKKKVHEDDSVLVYFAGHGTRIEKGNDTGAIYGFDVDLDGRTPVSGYLGLHSDLLDRLASKARHKLLILDSCHSGEIFNAGRRDTNDVRGEDDLFYLPATQAIASCRGSEVALDGTDGHSPFTQALLNGLQRLPARYAAEAKKRVWTSQLFRKMRSEIAGQHPSCGNLSGEGEFHFFPQGDFSEFQSKDHEFRALQAMVPGEYGFWWFDEMPWFIPSVRSAALANQEGTRSSIESVVISRDVLKRLANDQAKELQQSLASAAAGDKKSELDQLRYNHLSFLLGKHKPDKFRTRLEEMVGELVEQQANCKAPDLHLLAVMQHWLGNQDEQAETNFDAALKMYEAAGKSQNALRALCLADLAFHLKAKSHKRAAELFHDALHVFDHPPASFKIHILCEQASVWNSQKQWGRADLKLQEALDTALLFDPQHYLTANVLRRRAWSQITQWRVDEAEQSFRDSNEILVHLMSSPQGEEAGLAAGSLESIRQLPRTRDYRSLLAYLHNLHGLAMTVRYQGDSSEAARQYRAIVHKIAQAHSRLMLDSAGADVDSRMTLQLLSRLINTQERLGDCNLFGDPKTRDLREAIDDYRRALNLCHDLGDLGNGIRANLLFKQALAMCCEDPNPLSPGAGNSQRSREQEAIDKNLELAKATCDEATVLCAELDPDEKDVLYCLAELTNRIVDLRLYDAEQARQEDSLATSPVMLNPTVQLRNSIIDLREGIGTNLHRDQLELFLFANRTLLEHAGKKTSYEINNDTELLLSFCRRALAPYEEDRESKKRIGLLADTRAYLRPYYDAAMRSKLDAANASVKDLVEIQWQATHGKYYVKDTDETPVIALYVLDDDCLVLMDLPHGASKCYRLSEYEEYSLAQIRAACEINAEKLRLPREASRELSHWYADHRTRAGTPVLTESNPAPNGTATVTVLKPVPQVIDCLWATPRRPDQASSQANSWRELPSGQFPFEIPDEFSVHALGLAKRKAKPTVGTVAGP